MRDNQPWDAPPTIKCRMVRTNNISDARNTIDAPDKAINRSGLPEKEINDVRAKSNLLPYV